METGAGGHIQDPAHPPLLEEPDEEIPLSRGAGIPVDELVPFPNEAMDVLFLVEVRFPVRDGVAFVTLLCGHSDILTKIRGSTKRSPGGLEKYWLGILRHEIGSARIV